MTDMCDDRIHDELIAEAEAYEAPLVAIAKQYVGDDRILQDKWVAEAIRHADALRKAKVRENRTPRK